MILQAVPRSGAGYGGILLLCLIILIIYIVIKLIRKTPHKQPISKHLSNEEKPVKNNLYRADNNVKLCKQDNLDTEAFHIDDCINNKTREVSELDQTILNIIRIGANQTGILAAYKTRKKSIKLLKQQTSRVDCESYVDALILDFYPNEFKKAEQEKKFFIYLFCLVLFIIPSFVCGYITLEKLISYNFDLDVVYIWDSYSGYRLASEREALDIAPEEVAQAIIQVLKEQFAIDEEGLISETSRLFGYANVRENVHASMKRGIEYALKNNMIQLDGGRYK